MRYLIMNQVSIDDQELLHCYRCVVYIRGLGYTSLFVYADSDCLSVDEIYSGESATTGKIYEFKGSDIECCFKINT